MSKKDYPPHGYAVLERGDGSGQYAILRLVDRDTLIKGSYYVVISRWYAYRHLAVAAAWKLYQRAEASLTESSEFVK